MGGWNEYGRGELYIHTITLHLGSAGRCSRPCAALVGNCLRTQPTVAHTTDSWQLVWPPRPPPSLRAGGMDVNAHWPPIVAPFTPLPGRPCRAAPSPTHRLG